MRVVPNQSVAPTDYLPKVVGNDLYRKFKKPFDIILQQDFDVAGAYSHTSYVVVDPEIEEKIIGYLNSQVNHIIPFIGYTGIGKTHLLIHTLEDYYSIEKIERSNPVFYNVESSSGQCDLVYICAHERNNSTAHNHMGNLLVARINAMCDKICEKWELSISDDELLEYTKRTKYEILYYDDTAIKYGLIASKLKYLLAVRRVPIRNLVLIYDDLESLTEEQQRILVQDLMAFYECLRSADSKTHFEFFFCLRISTYHNLSTQPSYDTHRTEKALILNKVPSLKRIFERRFDDIVRSEGLYQKAGNQETWSEAYSVLMKVAERIANLGKSEQLFWVNNNNISEALSSFAQILSNRFWVQRNKEPEQFFLPEYREFYISNAIVQKVLHMGENPIFRNRNNSFLYSIFYEGGKIEYDFMNLYILLLFNNKYNVFLVTNNFLDSSIALCDVIDILQEILYPQDIWKRMGIRFDRIFKYLQEAQFISKDDFPRANSTAITDSYYLTPRGHALFEEFLNSNILFEIYRDNFIFDTNMYISEVSVHLSEEAILKCTPCQVQNLLSGSSSATNCDILHSLCR